jgi:DNA-binding MarR family transcriptional regulator
MNAEQFCERMNVLLPQIMKGMAQNENNYLSQGKITLPQFRVLVYLLREGEKTMSNAADMLGVSKPSATGTVDCLIAQGLVGRRHDKEDRRIVWIAITSQGKKIADDILKQKRRTMIKIFGSLSSAARARYLELFEQIAKILNTPSVTVKTKI